MTLMSVLESLRIEFQKTKRKSPLLLVLIVIAINVGYLFVGMTRNNMKELSQGWETIFFYLPIMNTIFLSVLVAVIASRTMDLEHKNSTWNILQSVQSKKSIYIGKIAYGAVWILVFDFLELALSIVVAKIIGLKGLPSAHLFVVTFVATFMAAFLIYQIQLILSLLFQNQFAALSISLFGTLIGLFGSYVSNDLLLPWSLFGTLRALNMDYEQGYEVALYADYYVPVYVWIIVVIFLLASLKLGLELYRNYEEGSLILFKKKTIVAKSVHTSLPIEIIKLKRSPVWIAFVILPVISCVIGVFNFVNNQEVLSLTWADLWTQQSLFLGLFFIPPLIGIFCSLLWRMEHNGTNWNIILTIENPIKIVADKLLTASIISALCILWIGFLYIVSGLILGIKDSIPFAVVECMVCGIFGCIAISAIQIYLSLVIRSFAVPVGIALLGGFAGIMFLVKDLGFFLPYSLLQMGLKSTNLTNELNVTGIIIVTIGYLILFFGLSVNHLKRKDVRTMEG